MDVLLGGEQTIPFAKNTDGNVSNESISKELQLQSLLQNYQLSSSEGYPVLSLALPDGSQWSKLIWTRTSIPSYLNRWNTPEEVLSYLISFDNHQSWITQNVPNRPPSGTLRLYDKTKTKHFRDDGYDWKTRSSSTKTIREDRIKLKVQGQQLLCGIYTHSESNPFLHRRCYWFTQNPDIVLVHYLITDANPHKKKKRLLENGFEVTMEGTAPGDYALLAISDDNVCKYLARGPNGSDPKPLLKSLSRFVWTVASQNQDKCLGMLIKDLNKQLQENISPETQSESSPAAPNNNVPLLLIGQAIELLKMQVHSSQYGGLGLLPKGTGCLPPSVLLQAASQIMNSRLLPPHPSSSVPPSLAVTTPEGQLSAAPLPQATSTSILSQPQKQLLAESDTLEPIRPPSLDCIGSYLPESFESDVTAGPSHSGTSSCHSNLPSASGHQNDFNMETFSQFAQTLRNMNPLKDVQQLNSQEQIQSTTDVRALSTSEHQGFTTAKDMTHLHDGANPVPSLNETSDIRCGNSAFHHGVLPSQNESIASQYEGTTSQNGVISSQNENTASQNGVMSFQNENMASQNENIRPEYKNVAEDPSLRGGDSVSNGMDEIEWEVSSLLSADQISDLMRMDLDSTVNSCPLTNSNNSLAYTQETNLPSDVFLNQFFNEVSAMPTIPFNPDSLLSTLPSSTHSTPPQPSSSNPCTPTDNTARFPDTPDPSQLDIDNDTLTQLLASRSCLANEHSPPPLSPTVQLMDSLVSSSSSSNSFGQQENQVGTTFHLPDGCFKAGEAGLEPQYLSTSEGYSPSMCDLYAQNRSNPVPESGIANIGTKSSSHQNEAMMQSSTYYYQNGMESIESRVQDGVEPIQTTTFQMNVLQDMSTNVSNTGIQFGNSLLQHPGTTPSGHTPGSVSHNELPVPTNFPSSLSLGYRTSSPLTSPSSPSHASVSSLSTVGGESYFDQTDPPSVAELCEMLGESPAVQSSDFSHLSLSDSDQQELLKASLVIQNTMKKCKDQGDDDDDREKDAVRCIERSYKRYRELKLMKDAAARRIQFQYRLYKRRTQELNRATLFIQQMYRYQKHKHHSSSQK